jgi:phenylacetate-CoA ligase
MKLGIDKMYSLLAKYIIYPLGDIVLGTNIVKSLQQLEQSQWWNEQQIKKLQEEKLRKLLEHAYLNVPYYRKMFDRQGIKPSQISTIDDLKKIPILTRRDVKENFPKGLVANNIPKDKILPGMTGGSTGRPLQFYRYVDSTSLDWGATLRAWGWAGYHIGNKYATLWGHPLTLKQQTRFPRRLQNFIMRNLLLSAYDIDEKTLHKYMIKLEEYQPEYIRGYTSAVYLLARYMRQQKKMTIKPKAIFTTSEMLLDHQRQLIENQFECKVFDNYGSGEIHAIASECEQHSGYHISAENVIVEVVNENGSPAQPGKEGELVITDLNNLAYPFIRYNIEDMSALISQPCACGRGLPLIGSIKGRVSDILVMPNGKQVPLGYWVVLFETLIGIDQYQIIQDTPTHLTVKIVKNSEYTHDDLTHITENLKIIGGDELTFEIQPVDEIQNSSSGKRRFVISNI